MLERAQQLIDAAQEDVKEFKMTLQCRGMKIDGVTREKIEGKKLGELIEKAAQVQ